MSSDPTKAPRHPSPAAVENLRANIGDIKTTALQQLDEKLPWYRDLPAGQRALLGQIASQGLNSFASWFTDEVRNDQLHLHQVMAAVFGDTPIELSRKISLRQASQLVRAVLEAVETSLPEVMSDEDKNSTREAVLWYSREIAFALADVYARAAETRGSWDTRIESLLLDAVLSGDDPDGIRSRSAAFGWRSDEGIIVAVGKNNTTDKPGLLATLHQRARRLRWEALVGAFSDRLVIVLGGVDTEDMAGFEREITEFFTDESTPIVYGPAVNSLVDAHHSAHAAIAGFEAVRGRPNAPRPTAASDLLPERLLNGDHVAMSILISEVYAPLQDANKHLLETVDSYIRSGQSLEATSRELFIHVNTVRYRLRGVEQATGLDPTYSRDAYVLQIALTVGRLT